MKITFLRHGQSTLNEKGVYYGRLNPGLTPKGREAAREIGKKLGNYDKIYVSPLNRAKETAQLALDHDRFITDSRLEELHFGIFEGLSYKDIKNMYKEEHDKWVEEGIQYKYPQGESIKEMIERVTSFIDEIRKTDAKEVLIVTHFGVICAVLSHYIAGNIDSFWKFKSELCTLTVIEFLNDFPVLHRFSYN